MIRLWLGKFLEGRHIEKRGEFQSLSLHLALFCISCVLFSLFEPWKNIKLPAAEVGKGLASEIQGSRRESDEEVERRKWFLEGGSGQPRVEYCRARKKRLHCACQHTAVYQDTKWDSEIILGPWFQDREMPWKRKTKDKRPGSLC